MADLIERKPLYEQTAKLEAQALDYVGRLIERDGEEPSEEWRVWSAILTERTAFKHDIFDAPSVEPEYEPVEAEDFAKTMSENSLYNFVTWHQEALTLMKEHGFVICKKTM